MINFLGEVFQVNATTILEWDNPNEFGRPKPIILTSEWLLKLGFEKEDLEDDDSERNIYQRPAMSSMGRKLPFVIEQCLNGSYSPVMYNDIHEEIIYIHQLQNLYHALTQEELTLK